MTVKSISSVVTTSFIQRFQGLAQQETGQKATGATAVSLGSGLRLGAQTLGNAVKSLNSVIGVVNVSQSTINKLLEVTDELISVTSQAYESGIGNEMRQQLNSQFEDLAEEFRTIVRKAKVGDFEILTEDGLSELFQQIGLDKEKSQSVARVFKDLNLVEDDAALASELSKAERPLGIPASAYAATSSGTEYYIKKITDASITGAAAISTVGAVYTDDVAGDETPQVTDPVGAVSQPATTVAGDVTILAVNESDGSYIGKSTEDVTGNNASNFTQLFLFDSGGTVVRQITQNADVNVDYVSADLSQDNASVAYVSYDTTTPLANRTLEVATVTTPSEYPPVIARAESITAGSGNSVKISNSGDYFAYQNDTGGILLERVSDGAVNSAANVPSFSTFGFISDGRIAYMAQLAGTMEALHFDDGLVSQIQGIDPSEDNLVAILEANVETGGGAAFVTTNLLSGPGITDHVNVHELVNAPFTLEAAEVITTHSLAGLSAGSFSVAHNAADPSKIEVGILASLPTHSNDSDVELYRLVYNPLSREGRRVSSTSIEPEQLLDSTILSRPDAYRVLKDLTALREQLTDNVDALQNIKKLISDNLTLVRETGLAFLDASGAISDTAKAEDVARQLQQLIKQRTGLAIAAQAENLEALTVSALAFADD